MFTIEMIVCGVAVRVAVTQIDEGMFRGTVIGNPHAQGVASTPEKAAQKAAARQSRVNYNLSAA